MNIQQQNLISHTANKLIAGSVCILPTDTIYGLCCIGNNHQAIERIYQIKNRPKTKTFAVLVSDFDMLRKFCIISGWQFDLIEKHRKNGFSFICQAKDNELSHIRLNNKICIRMIENNFIEKITKEVNFPIVATSCNISGEKEAFLFSDIQKDILHNVDCCIEKDSSVIFKSASTIIDITDEKIQIIRQGIGKINI